MTRSAFETSFDIRFLVIGVALVTSVSCFMRTDREHSVAQILTSPTDSFLLTFDDGDTIRTIGTVVDAASLDMLGRTPVVLRKRTYSSAEFGNLVQYGIDRFPDLEPIRSQTMSRDADVVTEYAPGYVRVSGTDRDGLLSRVERRHDARPLESLDFWIRAAPLRLGYDTAVTTHLPRTGTFSTTITVLRQDTIDTGTERRAAWVVRAEQDTFAAPVTHWWIDVDTRRLLRQTLDGPLGTLHFTLRF